MATTYLFLVEHGIVDGSYPCMECGDTNLLRASFFSVRLQPTTSQHQVIITTITIMLIVTMTPSREGAQYMFLLSLPSTEYFLVFRFPQLNQPPWEAWPSTRLNGPQRPAQRPSSSAQQTKAVPTDIRRWDRPPLTVLAFISVVLYIVVYYNFGLNYKISLESDVNMNCYTIFSAIVLIGFSITSLCSGATGRLGGVYQVN